MLEPSKVLNFAIPRWRLVCGEHIENHTAKGWLVSTNLGDWIWQNETDNVYM
jgi:hypothetical protein